MNISKRYFIREKDLVTRCVAGETIIVPIRGNVGDLNSIYTLNEVGTKIWELIDGKGSVEQIVEAICDAYEVTPEEAEKDAFEFLVGLEEAGLIRLPINERPSGP
jgi:hypothetical protein